METSAHEERVQRQAEAIAEFHNKLHGEHSRVWSNFQQAIFRDVAEGEGHTVVLARAGSGKCLGRGTPVLMFDGSTKNVEEVVVGDQLMGPDSEPRTVLSLARGSAPMYRITPIKGDSWVCNDVHVLTLAGTNWFKGQIRDVALNDLIAECGNGRLDRNWKLFRVGVQFPSQPVKVDPYLLGVWLGDRTRGESIITNSEPEIIDYLRAIAPVYGAELVVQPEPENGTFNLRFRAAERGTWTRGTEFTLRKFFTACETSDGYKFIPREYLINDERTRMQLLAGLLDTDGYYNNGYYEICSVSHAMAEQILFLARSLGLAAYCSDKTINGVVYKRITISGHLNRIPCIVTRKKAAPRTQVKRVTCTGFTASPVGDGEYFGFTLDRDGRFLLGDFTVTHNTSTIMHALTMIPSGLTTLVCAFNKSIEKELTARVQKAGLSVEVKTLHAFGFRAIGRAFRPRLNEYKVRDILEKLVPGDDKRERRDELRKCVSLCKGNLIESEDLDAVDGVCIDYGIDSGEKPEDRIAFCKTVLEVMDLCARNTKEVDFDDMVWLPVVLDLNVWQFDRVFVDETQDLNAAQIELMLKACKRGGRICVVGDDRQAIYGFRGADSSAIPNLIRRLDAKTLPLSVTYRCARKIVAIAAQIVPDFEAAPDAKDGEIIEATELDVSEKAQAGDFILSRTNAPLVKHCLALLARGTAAAIQGRDVSAQLLKVVKKSKAKTIPDLAGWLREWRVRECERMLRKDPDADTTRITDTADCIDALCEGETSVASVVAKIQALFTDTDETRRVTLSSTHKAKGLERERAWILADTYRPTAGTEESNLWYVAVTRAKSTIFMVRKSDDEKQATGGRKARKQLAQSAEQ